MEQNSLQITIKKYVVNIEKTQKLTVQRNSQQNGRTEKLNGVLIQIAIAMIIDSHLYRKFWDDKLYPFYDIY